LPVNIRFIGCYLAVATDYKPFCKIFDIFFYFISIFVKKYGINRIINFASSWSNRLLKQGRMCEVGPHASMVFLLHWPLFVLRTQQASRSARQTLPRHKQG